VKEKEPEVKPKQYTIEEMLELRKYPKDPPLVNVKEYQRMQKIHQNRLPAPTEHGWKKLSAEARTKTTTQIQLILNRLVSTNCDEMTQEIIKLELNSVELLENLVEQIYEKAVREVKYVKIYGKMCGKLLEAELHKRIEDLPEDSKITFRKLLTDHCSKAFSDDMKKWKEARNKSREGLKPEQVEELDLEESKAKARYLGNIQFIAQLFLVKIVSVSVLTDCIIELIKSNDPPEEECIETLCKLMESVGSQLQEKLSQRKDKAQLFMDTLFKRFSRYSAMKDKYPNRIRFLLMDTIEMREKWTTAAAPVPRAASPMLHAPTPVRSSARATTPVLSANASILSATTPDLRMVAPTPTPLLSLSRAGEEVMSPPVVSPDPFKVTSENQAKAMNVISTELLQFVESGDREEFMESVKESINQGLYHLMVPGVLRFLLKDNAKNAKAMLDKVKSLLVDFVDDNGVKIREGLEFFKNDFLEYGEDAPSFAAEVTGIVFSALSKNDPEGEAFHYLLNCLASFPSETYWNAPNKIASRAGFSVTAAAEMFCDIIKDQKAAGRDPYADLCGLLDREAIDIRSMMPDSPDAMETFTNLAALMKEKSLEPLFPVLCDASLVVEPLAAMQPLIPEKLSSWIEGKTEARKGASSYFCVIVAEEVFKTLKTSTKDGNVQLAPWIPLLKNLGGSSSPVHYQVGLLNAMCRCWSATEKKAGSLKAMASVAKQSGLITKFAFDKWRVDTSDRNSTLKDEAFNNELTDLF